MRFLFYFVLNVHLCVGSTFGAPPPTQVFDYLRPILLREMSTAGDVWAYCGNGGYVFRFDMDVSGDGIPEMFLASSLWSWKSNITWYAFKGLADGDYMPYTYASEIQGISSRATELWLEESDHGYSIVSFGTDRGSYYLGRYRIESTKIVFDRKEIDESTFHQLEASPKVKRIVPVISAVVLADLLRNPNSEWKRFDFDSYTPNEMGYYIAPEDAERIKGLVNFTPDLALRWLTSAAAGKTPGDESVEPTPRSRPAPSTPIPSVTPTASPARKTPVVRTPAPAEHRALVWLWAIGILALAGTSMLVWKRRS